jgi:hypothetical protein
MNTNDILTVELAVAERIGKRVLAQNSMWDVINELAEELGAKVEKHLADLMLKAECKATRESWDNITAEVDKEKKSERITLEEFIATGKDCDDLGLYEPGVQPGWLKGRVYLSYEDEKRRAGYYIIDYWSDPNYIGPRWSVLDGNNEGVTSDLAQAEKWLYEVVDGLGGLDY